MTNMIEQVARALDGWDYAPCADGNPDCPGGLSCPKNINKAAIAAIKTMREPSEGMKAVVAGDWGRRTWDQYVQVIDAALEGSEQ